MSSICSPKPGSTKPVLRPDAAQATRPASSTATDQPRCAISRAAVSPARPGADHADIDVEIEIQPRALRRSQPGSPRTSPPPWYRRRSSFRHSLATSSRGCMLICRRSTGHGRRSDILYHDHAPPDSVSSRQGRALPNRAWKDRARALIERGRKDAAKIGAYMASHALIPDRVVMSPAARTQETWKYAAAAFQPAARRDVGRAALRRHPACHLRRHQGRPRPPPIRCWWSATIRACTRSR